MRHRTRRRRSTHSSTRRSEPATHPLAASGELAQIKIRYKEPTGSESKLSSFPIVDREASAAPKLRASVAAFGMLRAIRSTRARRTGRRTTAKGARARQGWLPRFVGRRRLKGGEAAAVVAQ
jgi:hypothetical protein